VHRGATTELLPARRTAILDNAKVLDDGIVVTAEGEVIPGVTYRPAAEPDSITVKPTPEAKAAAREALLADPYAVLELPVAMTGQASPQAAPAAPPQPVAAGAWWEGTGSTDEPEL
jgi:hypothetical protein